MLYRKAPPTPPRLLLRIVATAGAGALMGMAACSSSSVNGLAADSPADAADDADLLDASPVFTGLLANPDATLPCGGGPCGSVALPPDGGDAGGPVYDADAGGPIYDADAGGSPADASLDGSDAGVDSPDAIAHCGGFCGVVVHVDE
jgi:hypothetical protein